MKNIKLAVIGCGNRGRCVTAAFLRAAKGHLAVHCVYALEDSANGIDCARVALAADESALTGKTVSL